MREKASNTQSVLQSSRVRSFQDNAEIKARLNLNDLLQQRQKEKKLDKKTNLLIFSGATAVATIVIVILSL